MIKLDGNYGEGGGQIARTALALSTLFGEPFEIVDIRKGRCKAGLKPQHLTCITALQELCGAKVDGAELGSCVLRYEPGRIKPQTLSIDIGTAGSITLLLQSLLFPCFFSDKKIRLKIKGGTDVAWSMPFDYFNEILVPHLAKFCKSIDVKLLKRGYYPKGNGLVDITVKPEYKIYNYDNYAEFIGDVSRNVPDINLIEQGKLSLVKGVAHASSGLQKAEVAERMARAAKHALIKLGIPVKIRTEYQDTMSDGCGITLWGVFSKNEDVNHLNPIRIGADSLGEKGKKAEIVGKEAAERLMNEMNYKAPVDEYLADNLIPWLVFGGKMKLAKVSNHCLTNIYTVEQFLGKMFKVDNKSRLITVSHE
ncbi:RNA 3'-terminal phosphate cyclase [Candidatus Woesearchaeota archaeon]|nr:RNA 3'-terminal phosphate cyclase [Candidatus Woesearchaeota archaeon]